MTLAIILFVLGLFITYAGYKIIDNRKKYEFENRTDGGVVQFKNWKATKIHNILYGVGRFVGVVGVVTAVVGGFMLIIKMLN